MLILIAANSTALLSSGNQAAAIDLLSRIVTADVDLLGDTAQDVVLALSAVAYSAIDVSNATLLRQVGSVLDSLVLSQSNSLVAAMVAPGELQSAVKYTSTPTIQMMIAVDPPGSERLTSERLTVEGSPSSFDPMPLNLLPASVSIVTTFFSLAFDPYASGNGTALNTTGVTRLAFAYTDGEPITVANATTPIRFSLPAVDTSGDAQAICAFWNVDTGAYDTAGCAGVPSPYPSGHSVDFWPNFTAHSDLDLVVAWSITGPMVDDGNCFVAVLDCGADNPGPFFVDPRTREVVQSHVPGTIYPDPFNPLAVPAVSCAAANGTDGAPVVAPRALRVIYGTDCALWQPDNAYNCSWSNTKQAFVGDGCISSGPTQCMCRHLTDFASARTPKIETCSLSDMTSFSAADLLTKLKARRAAL
jgi:hypothetical protein